VVGVTGLSLQHLKEAARDRNGWRELIHVVNKGRDRLDGTQGDKVMWFTLACCKYQNGPYGCIDAP